MFIIITAASDFLRIILSRGRIGEHQFLTRTWLCVVGSAMMSQMQAKRRWRLRGRPLAQGSLPARGGTPTSNPGSCKGSLLSDAMYQNNDPRIRHSLYWIVHVCKGLIWALAEAKWQSHLLTAGREKFAMDSRCVQGAEEQWPDRATFDCRAWENCNRLSYTTNSPSAIQAWMRASV
jgi:hypothetical protein